jgi:N-acetylmuramoyl-L-alanine amidase
MTLNIIKDYLKINPYTRPGRKNHGIKGIVEHYTAVPRATAKNIRDSFNGWAISAKRYASAHYAVDKNEIRQMIPDNEVAYHAHDRSRCYVDALKPNANFTSLSIEICIEADGSFHPNTLANARKLTAYLLKKYNLPVSRVYRHYDVTGKNCPAQWVKNPAEFTAFKNAVQNELSPAPSVHKDDLVHTVVKGDTLWGIARDHKTTVANIKTLNKLSDDVIHVGQRLIVKQVQPSGVQASKPSIKPVSKPKPKYTIPTATLRMGDRGTQVRYLQECLNGANFRLRGKVDGIFGSDTLQALKRFQSVYANPVDGIYGAKTREALRRVLKV